MGGCDTEFQGRKEYDRYRLYGEKIFLRTEYMDTKKDIIKLLGFT